MDIYWMCFSGIGLFCYSKTNLQLAVISLAFGSFQIPSFLCWFPVVKRVDASYHLPTFAGHQDFAVSFFYYFSIVSTGKDKFIDVKIIPLQKKKQFMPGPDHKHVTANKSIETLKTLLQPKLSPLPPGMPNI